MKQTMQGKARHILSKKQEILNTIVLYAEKNPSLPYSVTYARKTISTRVVKKFYMEIA